MARWNRWKTPKLTYEEYLAELDRRHDEREAKKAAERAAKEAPKEGEPTDAEVFERANRDRAAGLGRYGMTSAMREEVRRAGRHDREHPTIWDE